MKSPKLHGEKVSTRRVPFKNAESKQKAKRAHCSKTEINQEASCNTWKTNLERTVLYFQCLSSKLVHARDLQSVSSKKSMNKIMRC